MKYFVGFILKLIMWIVLTPAVIALIIILVPVFILFAVVGILEDAKNAVNRWSE